MTASAFGTFFLPGPTEVRSEVLRAMARPMVSHRGSAFRTLFARLQGGLRTVFATTQPVYIATCSATGLMEAAIRNAPPGRVLALVNGGFSERFARIAEACGRTVDRYEVPWGSVHVAADAASRIRAAGHALVTVVHSETSTGALNDVRAISDAAHAEGAICVIDSVSGVRGAELRFDAWDLDFALTGSQKALAIPPGLAFAVALERFRKNALEEVREGRGAYFDLTEFANAADRDEAPNTPALPLYFALDAQLDSVVSEGLEAAWARHSAMSLLTAKWARELREASDVDVAPLVALADRSPTVTALTLPARMTSDAVLRAVAERGYTIGGGYGKLKATTIRIGHMGDHTPAGLERCLAVCAEVLKGGS